MSRTINYGLPAKVREFAIASTRLQNKIIVTSRVIDRFELCGESARALDKLSRHELETLERDLIRVSRKMIEKAKA